jgi:hypothetical protein
VAAISVSRVIEAPTAAVWADLRDLSSHVAWMADAESITFLGEQREGVRTRFDCLTPLGPLRLTDRMVVTEWVEGRVIGVRHEGVVTGEGRFVLVTVPGDATELTWTERLVFPARLGGRVGAWPGGAVLRLVWARNLAALQRRIEQQLA